MVVVKIALLLMKSVCIDVKKGMCELGCSLALIHATTDTLVSAGIFNARTYLPKNRAIRQQVIRNNVTMKVCMMFLLKCRIIIQRGKPRDDSGLW